MTQFFLRLKTYHLPILSGLLVATSYPPFPAWAILFCWVPLWIFCSKQESLTKTFWAGWLTQFILSLIGFHWVAHTAHTFGNLPWFVAFPALLAFAGLVHLHIPASVVIVNALRGKKEWPTWAVFMAYAIIFSLLERVWPMIFPWHLGYSLLFSRLEIYQLAEWVGFSGLSIWLSLLNAMIATGVLAWVHRRGLVSLGVWVGAALIIFLGGNIAGSLIRPHDGAESAAKTIKSLIVQANIGHFDKIMAEKNLKSGTGDLQRTVQKIYFDLTDEALEKFPEAELIVWPETALADYLDVEYLSRPRQLELREKVLSWNRALVTGAYSREIGTDNVFNAIFAFTPQGTLSDSAYRKSQLLAFGEYLPGSEAFPWLLKIVPFVSNFARGPGPQIKSLNLNGKSISLAPQICYESLYPDFNRSAALMGGEVIINVTNDSWFGESFEPFQHGTMNWARAIETRRPLIRATNTGQSSMITHTGRVLIKSPIGQSWYGLADIPIPQKTTTFYMKYGYLDWIVYLMFLLILIWRMKRREN